MPKRESNIYHRKDGRWEGRFHIDGTKKYISVYGKTYQEAREKLHKLKEERAFSGKKCAKYMNDLIDEWFMSIQKTESSFREIPLPKSLVNILEVVPIG